MTESRDERTRRLRKQAEEQIQWIGSDVRKGVPDAREKAARQIENMMYCMGEDTESGGPYMDDVGGKELLSFIRTCGDADLQTLLYTRAAARGAKCRKYSEHSEAATFEYFATRLQEFAPKSVAVAAVPGPT